MIKNEGKICARAIIKATYCIFGRDIYNREKEFYTTGGFTDGREATDERAGEGELRQDLSRVVSAKMIFFQKQ